MVFLSRLWYSLLQGPCRLVPYITPSGQSPVLKFLEELERYQPENYALYLYEKGLIEEHGTDIGTPHWKWLGDQLGEIRWSFQRLRMRIYCSEEVQKRVVMLHGEPKKWRFFENDTRDLCLERRADFRSPTYDQRARELLRQQRKNNA